VLGTGPPQGLDKSIVLRQALLAGDAEEKVLFEVRDLLLGHHAQGIVVHSRFIEVTNHHKTTSIHRFTPALGQLVNYLIDLFGSFTG
jgi:hypothetical protein